MFFDLVFQMLDTAPELRVPSHPFFDIDLLGTTTGWTMLLFVFTIIISFLGLNNNMFWMTMDGMNDAYLAVEKSLHT